MATLVIIPNCDYVTFEAIRDEILDKRPFALKSVIYSKNRYETHFFFHDVKYIPPELMKYAIIGEMKQCDFSHINFPLSEVKKRYSKGHVDNPQHKTGEADLPEKEHYNSPKE